MKQSELIELLKIMLKQFKLSIRWWTPWTSSDYSGLCAIVNTMYHKGIITLRINGKLHDYIQSNRPSFGDKLYKHKYRDSLWFWKTWAVKPRIKWLKTQIKIEQLK